MNEYVTQCSTSDSVGKKGEFEMLHDLTRKELISDLIMDELYNAISLDSKGKPDFNKYEINDDLLISLIEKYDKERFEKIIEKLKSEEE